ncbi:MAG TPA: Crp/Fnr family transcriptional regulator, partial [Ruminococcaceae bacterium]|nr:Crp/Fnr family transcriptional regulator [Oscillospiraceae bacterium]
MIRSGQVRSYILSEEGREVTLFRLYERDVCIFSASCIMKNIQFDVYTQAVEDSDAILIPTPVY